MLTKIIINSIPLVSDTFKYISNVYKNERHGIYLSPPLRLIYLHLCRSAAVLSLTWALNYRVYFRQQAVVADFVFLADSPLMPTSQGIVASRCHRWSDMSSFEPWNMPVEWPRAAQVDVVPLQTHSDPCKPAGEPRLWNSDVLYPHCDAKNWAFTGPVQVKNKEGSKNTSPMSLVCTPLPTFNILLLRLCLIHIQIRGRN